MHMHTCCTPSSLTILHFFARRAVKALWHAINHRAGSGVDQSSWADHPTAGVGWGRPFSVRYNTRRWALPTPLTTRDAAGAWVGARKSSRDDVSRSFLRESGIGLARSAALAAPLSRASLLDAMRGFGSLRREDAQPPVAPRREGDTRQQKVLRTSHVRYPAHQKAQRIWAARATDGLSFDARIMRTPNAAAAPDDPRTQDQRDVTRCRLECD